MDGGFADYDFNETQQHHNHQYEDYSEFGVENNSNVDSQNSNPRDSSAGKLFVGGVPWETSEEAFSSYFSEYGEITDSVLMRDKHTGRPRGFGFVTFADSSVADKVLEKDHVIDGRTVEVKRTVPREDMGSRPISKTKKIFVGGIPPSLTEDNLKEYFEAYGSILEQQIMLDRTTGRSRGFGFVTFESEESVEKIFSDGEKHELGGRQVEIKRAEPKRAGGDYTNTGGGKSHGAFGSDRGSGYGGNRYSGQYNGGDMNRGYGGGYGDYGGYGGYGGGYGATPAGFYGGYGGYGYGFVAPMYGGYGAAGYANPSAYMGAAAADGYSSGKGFGGGGIAAGYGNSSKGGGYGSEDGYNSSGSKGGFGSSSSGGYGKGHDGPATGRHDGHATGRYHPYNRR